MLGQMKPFVLMVLVLTTGCESGYIDPKRIPELQREATNACLCESKKGSQAKDECWSGFWNEVNKYKHTETASACGPGSSAYLDFELQFGSAWSSGDRTVTTEWGYGACSSDQVASKKAEYEKETESSGC
jgi:hypothetical protein